MEQSTLVPFVRENLDILFVALNPALKSSRNHHYFSVNQAFWNQLYDAGLLVQRIDKSQADEVVFGGQSINFQGWSYGMTDLITSIAESDSQKIKPTQQDCLRLRDLISKFRPKSVILLHSKVIKAFLSFLGHDIPPANSGLLGELIPHCPTRFFNIGFPHGNTIPSSEKVAQYQKVKEFLMTAHSGKG